jgi:hypothetical protein
MKFGPSVILSEARKPGLTKTCRAGFATMKGGAFAKAVREGH